MISYSYNTFSLWETGPWSVADLSTSWHSSGCEVRHVFVHVLVTNDCVYPVIDHITSWPTIVVDISSYLQISVAIIQILNITVSRQRDFVRSYKQMFYRLVNRDPPTGIACLDYGRLCFLREQPYCQINAASIVTPVSHRLTTDHH